LEPKEAFYMRVTIALFMALFLAGAAFAQADAEGDAAASKPFAFTGGIELATDVLPGLDENDKPITEAWTRLGFQPDIAFGKFGVGVDLSIHFQMYPTADQAIQIYKGDWVPDYEGSGKSFLDLYLPKILYVRYGLKGADPFFVKLGSIDDLTLGNGFIMGEYSNMKFMPDLRIFGLDLGLDGSLFNFPYVGLELIGGNLARFDVIGGRVFARPFVGTEIPILKNLQAGFTLAMDTNPYLYDDTKTAAADPVSAYGLDVMVPILGGKLFPLAAFMDVAFAPNAAMGGMIGCGGRLLGIFRYGAQLRVIQDGFIPAYFDANYDLYRSRKYDFVKDEANKGSTMNAGWYASLGTSFLEDKIVFNTALDGPFSAIPAAVSDAQSDYPHLKAIFNFGEGIVGGVSLGASYEKYFLGRESGFFKDLIDPTDAVIGLAVNYKTGASVLTLKYNANWNPDFDNGDGTFGKFEVSSSLSASMKF